MARSQQKNRRTGGRVSPLDMGARTRRQAQQATRVTMPGLIGSAALAPLLPYHVHATFGGPDLLIGGPPLITHLPAHLAVLSLLLSSIPVAAFVATVWRLPGSRKWLIRWLAFSCVVLALHLPVFFGRSMGVSLFLVAGLAANLTSLVRARSDWFGDLCERMAESAGRRL